MLCSGMHHKKDLNRFIWGCFCIIYKLFNRLERQRPKIDTLYVELYGTLSEKDFVAAILASLNQIESKLEKLVKLIRIAVRSVKLGMSIDPITGLPGVSVSFDSGYNDYKIQEVMFKKWIQTYLLK